MQLDFFSIIGIIEGFLGIGMLAFGLCVRIPAYSHTRFVRNGIYVLFASAIALLINKLSDSISIRIIGGSLQVSAIIYIVSDCFIILRSLLTYKKNELSDESYDKQQEKKI